MGNTTSDGSRSYSYNQAGQLAQVNGATYSYNAKRQRSRKVVGAQGTVFHYDLQGNLIAETDANGNLIRDYVWVNSMPIAQVEAGEHIRYLHSDHLNTPRLATNASGVKVWGWEGEAFGATLPNEDPDGDGRKTVIDLRFAGMIASTESGLFYGGARYWDPRLGRSITADPVSVARHARQWMNSHGTQKQFPLELNPYAYVANNPLRWTDPTGLAVWICSRGAFGGTIGNHSYIWDGKNNRCCGMNRPHDAIATCAEGGPQQDSCTMVPGSDGREDEIMNCCRQRADTSFWPKYDCHDLTSDCITRSGLTNPGSPGGRFGTCGSCSRQP